MRQLASPCAASTQLTLVFSTSPFSAAWAAQLADEYAPEINIVGAATGGTPADLKVNLSDRDAHVIFAHLLLLQSVLINLNKSLFASVALSALVGQANAYPEVSCAAVLECIYTLR